MEHTTAWGCTRVRSRSDIDNGRLEDAFTSAFSEESKVVALGETGLDKIFKSLDVRRRFFEDNWKLQK